MEAYRAAIVGLSWIGADPAQAATHPTLGSAVPYSHASALAATAGVSVVAACDVREDACNAFAAAWSERWPGLRTYTDYRQMLRSERIDLLSIVTPDHLHEPVLQAAAEANIRAVFCEKPLATDLAAADRMIELCRRHRLTVAVNHTRRWLPDFVAARELVRGGAIGRLAQVAVHLGGPRAMLFRNHSHSLDLINYFAEGEPKWVFAELEPGFENYGPAYAGDGGHDPATEPGVNAYIAYANGVRGLLSGMKASFEEVRVAAVGERGRVDIDESGVRVTVKGPSGQTVQAVRPRATLAGMQGAVADILSSLASRGQTQSPPEEARKAVALTTAILASAGRGPVMVS